jgi:hypothetical protein
VLKSVQALSNIWNFSDMQVSIVFYGGFLGLSVVASVVIFLFSVSYICFCYHDLTTPLSDSSIGICFGLGASTRKLSERILPRTDVHKCSSSTEQ